MTQACEAISEKLTALVDGELSEEETALVRAHLAECPSCSAEIAAIEQTLRLADVWQIEESSIAETLTSTLSPPSDLALILTELRALRQEVTGLRSEMAEMNEEMGKMRRQIALTRASTAPAARPRSLPQIMPLPPASDPIGLF